MKKESTVFNDRITPDEYKEMVDTLVAMIADARNAWILPYLAKQLEAFELLKPAVK